MASIEPIRMMIEQGVPFNRSLGLRVEVVEPERAEVVLPEAAEHLNHVGTLHAAAQFALGEATSGTMVISALADLLGSGFVPLAAQASITYRRPARGQMRGIATLAGAEQARIRQELTAQGKSRFTVPVQLVSAEGEVTTDMEVAWVVLKR